MMVHIGNSRVREFLDIKNIQKYMIENPIAPTAFLRLACPGMSVNNTSFHSYLAHSKVIPGNASNF